MCPQRRKPIKYNVAAMKLSIVTINYNDATGLAKTLKSVADQHILAGFELEHIIIDGGSTDNSVETIKGYRLSVNGRYEVKWLSEKDKGVYNAMNKGIEMATGDYIQILNSGDILASLDVLARMSEFLNSQILDGKNPEILYGNMLKAMPDGKLVRDNCGGPGVGSSFLYFYRGTLNHDCAWIKRELFERFDLYNEEMRICSDWEWYIRAIVLGGVKPVYANIDVTIFDMNGISESGGKNKAIIQKERRDYLEQILPASVLADYDTYTLPVSQYERLKKHHLWRLVNFVERVLFKLEKWNILKK